MRRASTLLVPTVLIPLMMGNSLRGQDPKAEGDRQNLVPNLIKELQKDDANAKIKAATALADLGAQVEAAVPELIATFKLKDEDVRLNAAIALGKIGKAAVPALAKELASDDADVRFYTLTALGWIGSDAKATAPAVIEILKDKDPGVRRKAAYALGRIARDDPKNAIIELVKTLADADANVGLAASEGLGKLGKPAVPALIEVLKANDVKAMPLAAQALAEIGPDAKEAIPALKDMLVDQRFNLLNPAAKALVRIGKESIPIFIDALKSNRQETRTMALLSLGEIGADAAPALVDAMSDGRADVRRFASLQLSRMKIADRSVVLALAHAINDEDEGVQVNAFDGLAALGALAQIAIPPLQATMNDSDYKTRARAFHALEKMGENPRDQLLKGLDSFDVKVRINSASLMAWLNIENKLAFPVLIDGLNAKDADLRLKAALPLAWHKVEISKVAKVLIEGIQSKSPKNRREAVEGVHLLDGHCPEAAAALVDLLKDRDAHLRHIVISQLSKYRGNPEVLAAMVRLLKDEDASVRQIVLQAMQEHGPQALPSILEAVLDKNEDIRQHALAAVKAVEGELHTALPALEPLLKRKEPEIRQAVVVLLTRMGEAGAPGLVEALKDEDKEVRGTALKFMADTPTIVPKAAAGLLDIVEKDKDLSNRKQATTVLVRMDEATLAKLLKVVEDRKDLELHDHTCIALHASEIRSKVILPFLTRSLKVKSDTAPWISAFTLGNMGQQVVKSDEPEGKEAIAALMRALNDGDEAVRRHAVYAIAKLGHVDHPSVLATLKGTKELGGKLTILHTMHDNNYRFKEGVPALVETLKDPEARVRSISAQILGRIGADAKDALPTLRAAVQDKDNTVRTHAQAAIRLIERE